MTITFIRLAVFKKGYKSFYPLVFPIVASLTPEDVQINFIDEHIEALPEKIDSDIIAFSVETFTAKKAYILAKKYKTSTNHIVMGGFHPSVEPEESLKYADTVIVGDAEDTWGTFISDFKTGQVKKIYRSSYDFIPKKIDYNFEKFKNKGYSYVGAIQTSRGCKFNCDFCAVKAMYPSKVRFKSVEDTIAEIKILKSKFFYFVDDNLFLNEEVLLELLEKIKPLKKLWGCQISMDIAKDDKLLKAMKEAGCRLVLIGFESIKKETLENMNKSANLNAKEYDKVIKRINKHGIMIYATFVLGYDSDDLQTFKDTTEFALENHFTLAAFNMLQPMPGTNLYQRFKDDNRLIFEKWWASDEYRYGDPVFFPKNFSPEELKQAYKRAYDKFYSVPNILKRFVLNARYLSPLVSIIFLIENFLNKKSLDDGIGEILGEYLGLLNEEGKTNCSCGMMNR